MSEKVKREGKAEVSVRQRVPHLKLNVLGDVHPAAPASIRSAPYPKMWAACGFVGRVLWRGDVIGVAFALLYGSGVGAMYAHQYVIAFSLYFTAIVWLTAKTLTWDEAKRHHARGSVSLIIILSAMVVLGVSALWISHTSQQESAMSTRSKPAVTTFSTPRDAGPLLKPAPLAKAGALARREVPEHRRRPTPPKKAEPQTTIGHAKVEVPVQLSAVFQDPSSPSLIVSNPSDDVVENVLWAMVAFRTSDLAFFGFQTQSIGYIKAHSSSANYSIELDKMAKSTDGDAQIKEGDELTGSVSIDCPKCTVHTYVVHFIWRREGWYFEAPLQAGYVVPKDMSKEGRSAYIRELTGQEFYDKRIEIKPR
jgi:hypothetical protein